MFYTNNIIKAAPPAHPPAAWAPFQLLQCCLINKSTAAPADGLLIMKGTNLWLVEPIQRGQFLKERTNTSFTLHMWTLNSMQIKRSCVLWRAACAKWQGFMCYMCGNCSKLRNSYVIKQLIVLTPYTTQKSGQPVSWPHFCICDLELC